MEFFGYPGWGARYRSRFGTYDVSGGVYQKYAEGNRYECYVQPFLGAPVKAYGWVQEMNYGRGCWGQWFENGAIGYHDGRWNVMYGRYGQTGGMTLAAVRLKLRRSKPRLDAEVPPDPPTKVPHPPPPG